jgi:hypothetical protein
MVAVNIVTGLVATLALVCAIVAVIITAVAWNDNASFVVKIFVLPFKQGPHYDLFCFFFSEENLQFYISMGPVIPFLLVLAGFLKNPRLGLLGLGLFVAWAPAMLNMVRILYRANQSIDDAYGGLASSANRDDISKDDAQTQLLRFYGGSIALLCAGMLSMAAVG